MTNRHATRSLALRTTVALAVAIALVAGPGASGASARPGPGDGAGAPVVLAQGLAGPLQIDVGFGGRVVVAQAFSGTVSAIERHGAVTNLVTEPGLETAAVAGGPFGTVLYTRNNEGGSTSEVMMRLPDGSTKRLADLAAHESGQNPDGVRTYGIEGDLAADCAGQWPVEEAGPPQYAGIVESHPYALALTPFGAVVADAAANDLLLVDWRGRVRTLTVLPSQPTVITAEAAAANGLPDCVVGRTYAFEPVPTDVEVGRDGNLYVTTLPGGPEDPSLGARGSVYRVNLRTGAASQVATGFAGATNLAIGPRGTIYVSELFANRISRVDHGAPVPVVDLTEVAAVEYSRGSLFATTGVFDNGTVVRIPLGG